MAQDGDDANVAAHTPPRPPALTVGATSETPSPTPPGSPMDVDYEAGRSPSASPSAMASRLSKKPVISVFDWDDTLCPSSWLFREGLLAGHGLVEHGDPVAEDKPLVQDQPPKRMMDRDDKHALRVFEDHVLALLRTARQFGPVFIITAAKLHWVRHCATTFLPHVLQLFTKSDSIHVISAREFYADQSRRMGLHQSKQAEEGTPLAWKTVAFEAVCAHLRVDDFVRRSRNSGTQAKPVTVDFVSIGDSLCERDACRFLAMKAPSVLHSKTLKLLDQPKLRELLEQVKMTKGLYDQICRYDGSLDLHVVRGRAAIQVVQLDTAGVPRGPAHTIPMPPPTPPDQQLQRRSSTAQSVATAAASAVTAVTAAAAVASVSSVACATVSGPLTSM